MSATSAITTQDAKFHDLGLQKSTVNEEKVCCYTRALSSATEKNPVLVLLHGYPQSSYIWRHLIPLLPSESPLFVADLPGYGASAPIENNDKLSVGETVMRALKTEIEKSNSGKETESEKVPVILVAHDRGARVAHRLAVSGVNGFDIKAVCLMDIVPTTVQWNAFSTPSQLTAYFHFPLLANVPLATRIITSYGPSAWVHDMCHRWASPDTSSPTYTSFTSDSALEVYKGFFEQPHTVLASNKDYEAGATVDLEMQEKDMKEGKKIECEVLLLFSEKGIGGRFDVVKEWGEWVGECGGLKGVPIKSGHFVADEAPGEVAEALVAWLDGLKR